jgi:glutaredoxin
VATMKIYTSPNCPNCISLKQLLTKSNVDFEEIDGTTTKSVAFLRSRKLPLQLPIIEIPSLIENNSPNFFTYDQYLELLK